MRPAKRKIALVIGQLGLGGGEGQLFELATGLSREEAFEPHVYCLSARMEPYGRLLKEAGIEVTQISTGADFLRALKLARNLRSDGAELVHSFLFIGNRYSLLATKLMGGVPLVTSARNCKRDPGILGALNRAAFRASRAIVCNSHAVARYIGEVYRAPKERIVVIYNGVDPRRFFPLTNGRRSQNGGPVVIGTAGRVELQKNPLLFVEAAAELRRRIGDCRFLVAGGGSQLAAAKFRAASLGIGDELEFLGPRTDIPEFMRQLDVFWLTSDWEGTPNAVLEAMASGVPVVATRVGGCAEIIEDGRTGYLVPPGTVSDLVARTEILLKDRSKAKEIGRQAAETARKKFSIEAMVAAASRLYRRVLDIEEGASDGG